MKRGASRHTRSARFKPRGLPPEFIERLSRLTGDHSASVQRSFNPRPVTFRVNTLRAPVETVAEELRRIGLVTRRVPWYREGLVLIKGTQRELERTKLYEDGALYLQSLASMVPPLVLEPEPGERVLDITAAPGSKTGQIAQLMEGRGELTAVERDAVRFDRLTYNLRLLGVTDRFGDRLSLVRGDAARLTPEAVGLFDRILLDAPCSAEARFLIGQPRSFAFWSEARVRANAAEQWKLLKTAWGLLEDGGVLVYSTCTFAPEENECLIARLLSEPGVEARLEKVTLKGLKTYEAPRSWNGTDIDAPSRAALRILPDQDIEGFVVARLRKTRS